MIPKDTGLVRVDHLSSASSPSSGHCLASFLSHGPELNLKVRARELKRQSVSPYVLECKFTVRAELLACRPERTSVQPLGLEHKLMFRAELSSCRRERNPILPYISLRRPRDP